MHPNTDDNDLRALFDAMRQEETRQAPAFEPLWDEAVARTARRRHGVVWMRYAAVAALLVGLVLSAILLLRPPRVMSITEWRSPTQGLLPTSITVLDAGLLPTSALLAAPSPRLETYVPETQVFWPGEAIQPDTTN